MQSVDRPGTRRALLPLLPALLVAGPAPAASPQGAANDSRGGLPNGPPAGSTPAIPAAILRDGYRFRVVREGRAIGTHRVTFGGGATGAVAGAGGRLTALTEVDIDYRLLGLTVYRFRHRFEEVWTGDRLVSATSHLDRNGKVTDMQARSEGGALLAEGSAGRFRLPAEAAPLSWWDSRRFDRPLFDNDTGRPMALRWTRRALPDGRVEWQASGESDAAGTYAADGTWLGWRTKAEDGSTVVYEPG